VGPIFHERNAAMATYVFQVDRVEIHNQKAATDHSDDDWLTIICTVANPVTKDVQTFPAKIQQIGHTIHTGDTLIGPFTSNPITTEDSNIVIVNYLITNLGSSNVEDQFAQAVKVTDKVVGVVGPIAGAAIGLFVGDPAAGLKMGQEIAKGVDTVISTLSDVFDFLGIHFGPANCNGEVLHDTLTWQPNELKQALNQPASREYTGPQENSRCGMAPHSKVTFSLHLVRQLPVVPSSVNTVSRTPDHLDVFWVGPDGGIGTNWWDANINNGQWNQPFPIAPPRAAALGSGITVVARTPNHLDVFWVGPDGGIGTNWWDANVNNGRWNQPFPIAPPNAAEP
jgi:hypothetical protein